MKYTVIVLMLLPAALLAQPLPYDLQERGIIHQNTVRDQERLNDLHQERRDRAAPPTAPDLHRPPPPASEEGFQPTPPPKGEGHSSECNRKIRLQAEVIDRQRKKIIELQKRLNASGEAAH